jgi:hypothetical protein
VKPKWAHSALRPPIGLLCQHQVIMMMEKLVEWLAGETEVLGENLPQCRFVHHKPHMLSPDAIPGRSSRKPATNRLSDGTAFVIESKGVYFEVGIEFLNITGRSELPTLILSLKLALQVQVLQVNRQFPVGLRVINLVTFQDLGKMCTKTFRARVSAPCQHGIETWVYCEGGKFLYQPSDCWCNFWKRAVLHGAIWRPV